MVTWLKSSKALRCRLKWSKTNKIQIRKETISEYKTDYFGGSINYSSESWTIHNV